MQLLSDFICSRTKVNSTTKSYLQKQKDNKLQVEIIFESLVIDLYANIRGIFIPYNSKYNIHM